MSSENRFVAFIVTFLRPKRILREFITNLRFSSTAFFNNYVYRKTGLKTVKMLNTGYIYQWNVQCGLGTAEEHRARGMQSAFLTKHCITAPFWLALTLWYQSYCDRSNHYHKGLIKGQKSARKGKRKSERFFKSTKVFCYKRLKLVRCASQHYLEIFT